MFASTFLVVIALFGHGYANLTDELTLANSVKTFSNLFYRQVGLQDKSLVYSPFSIHSAFTMASIGSRGDTLTEFQQLLGTGQISNILETERNTINKLTSAPMVTVDIGNALFINPTAQLRPSYIQDATSGFQARVDYLDFSAPEGPEQKINDFVSDKTNGLIQEAMEKNSLTSDSLVVLVNTVFFNGTWVNKFNPAVTHERDFHKTDGSVSKVQMMGFSEPISVALLHDNENEIDTVELPYKGGRFSFYVVLPRNPQAMQKLESSDINLQRAISNFNQLTMTYQTVVSIPKFKIQSDLNLKEIMPKLGLQKAFDASQADFSAMTPEVAYISQAAHQAVISVAEDGTEAAAVTTITISREAIFMEEDHFIADKPFLYFITDKTNGQILFQGKFVGE